MEDAFTRRDLTTQLDVHDDDVGAGRERMRRNLRCGPHEVRRSNRDEDVAALRGIKSALDCSDREVLLEEHDVRTQQAAAVRARGRCRRLGWSHERATVETTKL